MFTGIVEEVGEILRLQPFGEGARAVIGCRRVVEDLQLGDSICVSGVCLTAVEKGSNSFTADVSAETLRRSWLAQAKSGQAVNLERAMAAGGRLGGHLVNGHVDGIGQVLQAPSGARGGEWWFSLPVALERYVVEKGSIAVDGISLTVAGLQPGKFSVAIIPATVRETNLKTRKTGDLVNLEVDILAKYVEKLLSAQMAAAGSGSLSKTLSEFGYL